MKLTQGEKLLILITRDGRTSEEIMRDLGYERTYLSRLCKQDRLPRRAVDNAIRVYGLPQDFFDNEDADVSPAELYATVHSEEMARELADAKGRIETLSALLVEAIDALLNKQIKVK